MKIMEKKGGGISRGCWRKAANDTNEWKTTLPLHEKDKILYNFTHNYLGYTFIGNL